MANSNKVYQIVTDKIIEILERGAIPWKRPWRGGASGLPRNIVSKKPYRGINCFLLAVTGEFMGYSSPYWLTYKQAQELGGYVKKGEKSTLVIFWKLWEKQDQETGQTDEIPVLRYYQVFNVDQCQDVTIPSDPIPGQKDLDFEPIAACENVVENMPNRPEILHSTSPKAYYSPSRDVVHMPTQGKFESAEYYYNALFHELTHSTGHEKRLHRRDSDRIAAFGDPEYSKEELVAEMGAAFLCSYCEIDNLTIENSAAYIQGWLKVLRDDNKMVIQAAAQAQKAADYILVKGGRW